MVKISVIIIVIVVLLTLGGAYIGYAAYSSFKQKPGALSPTNNSQAAGGPNANENKNGTDPSTASGTSSSSQGANGTNTSTATEKKDEAKTSTTEDNANKAVSGSK